METRNDYSREVFNGDLGTVVGTDDEEGVLIASFDGREVAYPFGNSTPWFLRTRHDP